MGRSNTSSKSAYRDLIASRSSGDHILGICKGGHGRIGKAICQSDHEDESDLQRRYHRQDTYVYALPYSQNRQTCQL
jgi:hypothetical protein